ncbi:hypothetical protein GCM10009663_38320 [Kitasatospora arboriphila]|uniref:Uncharacterized protein n=1 Tax=Kitasatospora arboriphila TaxID=258052 RepID=A0ABN1TK71_9ACTN
MIATRVAAIAGSRASPRRSCRGWRCCIRVRRGFGDRRAFDVRLSVLIAAVLRIGAADRRLPP